MQNLADAVLDYRWFLVFSEDDMFDSDSAAKLEEQLVDQIENEWTEDEKQALIEAAKRRLNWWLREPDEHGYTPRTLLTDEQKEFLEALAAGHFDGSDFDDDED